jgi:hypothetical protein
LREGGFLQLHPGEDVIARAVQYPVNAFDRIAGEPFPQSFDDGDAAGDGAFESESAAVRLRQFRQMLPMRRQQRLIRRDHAFASAKGRFYGLPRDAFGTAHEFDENIDVGCARERDGIGEPGTARKIDAALSSLRAGRDGDNLHGAARAGRKHRSLPIEKLEDGNADSAETGYADAQGRQHEDETRCSERRNQHSDRRDPSSRRELFPRVWLSLSRADKTASAGLVPDSGLPIKEAVGPARNGSIGYRPPY